MELTIDQALSKGIEAHQAGKLEEADKFYTAILRAQPNHPDANHNMGVIAIAVGKIQQALPFFKSALEANPRIAQYWLSYIDALIRLNKISEAKVVFEQAKDYGAKGEPFSRLAKKLNDLDSEGSYIKDELNILDCLTLDKALRYAGEAQRGGNSEKARDIYEDILAGTPKNKKADGGIKAISNDASSNVASVNDPTNGELLNLIELFNQGQFQDVLFQASIFLKQFPRSFFLHNISGASHARLRQPEPAIECFYQALEIRPDFADAHNNIGNALKEQGDLDAAIDSYKQALEINYNFAEAHHNLGIAFISRKEFVAGIESFQRAIKIRPAYPEAHLNLGSAYYAIGDFDAAINSYERCLKARPEYAEACFNKGNALKKKGMLDAAIEAFKHAIKLKPQLAEAHYNVGVVLMDKGEFLPAIDSFNCVLTLRPEYAEAYFNIGIALRELGRYDSAIDSFTYALELKPNYPEAHNNIGSIHKIMGNLDAAIESFKHAIKIKPEFADAYVNLGNALKDREELVAAADSYQKALRIRPNFAECHYNLGIVWGNIGDTDTSATCYRKAIAIRPDFAEAHGNLGNILKERGELNAAVESYHRALKHKPDYAEVYNNLGLTLHERGELDSAIHSLIQAIKISPKFDGAYTNLGSILKGVAFSSPVPDLIQIISELLDRNNSVRPIDVSRAGISLLKLIPSIESILNNSSTDKLKRSFQDVIVTLSNAPLLLQLMRLCPLPDIELESLLTNIRAVFLSQISVPSSSSDLIRFHSALALQCFTNEYIYTQTNDEVKQIEALEKSVQEAILAGQQPTPQSILCLASYKALITYEWASSLDVNADIQEVYERQYLEPKRENFIKKKLPVIGEITDSISSKVRQQYEENPFPRWVKLGLPLSPVDLSKKVEEFQLRLFDSRATEIKCSDILVAGCGTGQHPIGTAATYTDSTVLAIDLSLSSLAYAKRKTEELGLENIDYMQADILDLCKLNRQFDIVESAGVLHHMKDPMVGWRVLTQCLRPGGLMKVGLYSSSARKHITLIREEIRKLGIRPNESEMKSFRRALLSSEEPHHKWALELNDFYSMSELRDLVFHVQEHHFTILDIQECLVQLGLGFCGFETKRIVQDFKRTNTGADDAYDLGKWYTYENANPSAFIGMYQFWCQKLI